MASWWLFFESSSSAESGKAGWDSFEPVLGLLVAERASESGEERARVAGRQNLLCCRLLCLCLYVSIHMRCGSVYTQVSECVLLHALMFLLICLYTFLCTRAHLCVCKCASLCK